MVDPWILDLSSVSRLLLHEAHPGHTYCHTQLNSKSYGRSRPQRKMKWNVSEVKLKDSAEKDRKDIPRSAGVFSTSAAKYFQRHKHCLCQWLTTYSPLDQSLDVLKNAFVWGSVPKSAPWIHSVHLLPGSARGLDPCSTPWIDSQICPWFCPCILPVALSLDPPRGCPPDLPLKQPPSHSPGSTSAPVISN